MHTLYKLKNARRSYLLQKFPWIFGSPIKLLALTCLFVSPFFATSAFAQEMPMTPEEFSDYLEENYLTKKGDRINRFDAPPMLSYYPASLKTSGRIYMRNRWEQVHSGQSLRSRSFNGNPSNEGMPTEMEILEDESPEKPGENDTQDTGQMIENFGSGKKMVNRVFISGSNGPEVPVIEPSPATASEDDGAIPLSNGTGIKNNNESVIYQAIIGDGPWGSAEAGTGDFDFYMVSAKAGTTIQIDVNTPSPFEDLDPFIAVWDEFGFILAFNDDDAFSFDSFLSFDVPVDGNYFISVAGFGSFVPNDPFDPGSGAGFGSEGEYEIIFTTIDQSDVDFYVFDLKKGDLFGADITGRSAPFLSVKRPAQDEAVGTNLPSNIFYPIENPLPKMGQTSVGYIAEEDGKYAIEVSQNAGPYEMELFATRSNFEVNPRMTQVLFIDYDGSDFDAGEFFGGEPTGTVQLSPFRDFLENWGIENTDENVKRITKRITKVVEENIQEDLEHLGINENFRVKIVANDGTEADDFEPKSSPGFPVSKVIVGGTIEESGIGTIGIAQSIDLGNYDTEEIALVLLDVLSDSATGFPADLTYAINDLILAEGVDIEDAVVTAVGNVTSHEAGHYLGNWHNDGFNETSVIMDEGPGGFFNLAGVGPSGVFGAEDQIDVDFNADFYSTGEVFSGFENNAVNTAFALSFTNRGPLSGDPDCEFINLAEGKPAMQSSTYGNGVASIAVDGDTDGSRGPWDNPSIMHTNKEMQPWWSVDLEEKVAIDFIQIFNRTDCCEDRLKDFFVYVSSEPIDGSKSNEELAADPAIATRFYAGTPHGFEAIGLEKEVGRYVMIKLAGEGFLHFSELELYGCPIPECKPNRNLALYQSTMQSSTYGNGNSSIAVDGDIDGSRGPWTNPSIIHTEKEMQPWWAVDLGEKVSVESVRILNRSDCCEDRLRDFYVHVSPYPIDGSKSNADLLADPAISSEFYEGTPPAYEEIDFYGDVGRYVMVKLSGEGFLHFAEFEVFGCPLNPNSSKRFADARTGLSDAATSSLSAAPNPFSDNFLLEFRGGTPEYGYVELVNIVGQVVDAKRMENLNQITLGDGLPSGVYFVRFTEGEITHQLKVIKSQ